MPSAFKTRFLSAIGFPSNPDFDRAKRNPRPTLKVQVQRTCAGPWREAHGAVLAQVQRLCERVRRWLTWGLGFGYLVAAQAEGEP
ncbi:hypothetical protein PVK06_045658 [Gossypium arboreum]|uniref:Uncharacterized protein n=1 Tax=Gossypium arboreum TaxID=29729 RepID=A0ABR0MUP0_GOSAR|nr:hypothetical protein PVK06_045658 [Gossypium arboreum]